MNVYSSSTPCVCVCGVLISRDREHASEILGLIILKEQKNYGLQSTKSEIWRAANGYNTSGWSQRCHQGTGGGGKHECTRTSCASWRAFDAATSRRGGRPVGWFNIETTGDFYFHVLCGCPRKRRSVFFFKEHQQRAHPAFGKRQDIFRVEPAIHTTCGA